MEVVDADVNGDEFAIDSLVVVLSSESGDSETLYLYETGISSGVFRGSIAFDIQVRIFISWLKET